MKNNIISIMVFFLVLVFLSGCDGVGGGGVTPETINYHTGNLGITMSFLAASPPTNLFDGNNVPFLLEVKNQGASDTNPLIWLSGHDNDIIKINWDAAPVGTVFGKSPEYPVGDIKSMVDSSVLIELPTWVDTYSTNMKVTTCYTYTTQASTQVCVDPDPTNNQDDACQPKTISLSGGQGGPVAITHVKNEPSAGGGVMFTISIQNVGDGTIISSGRVSDCTTKITAADIDVINIGDTTLGFGNLACTPTSGTVRLVNGKGVIYCRMDGLTGNAYTTTLNIDISYGYKSSISKSFSVRRI